MSNVEVVLSEALEIEGTSNPTWTPEDVVPLMCAWFMSSGTDP